MLAQITDDSPFFERLSAFALDPVDLRRVMFMMIKTHFSNPAHYGPMTEIRDIYYKGADDPSGDNLHISLGDTVGDSRDARNVSRVPSIYVQTTDWQFGQPNINNFETVDTIGNESFRKLVNTACIIQHFTRSADTSLLLATQTAGFLSAISSLIKPAWNLGRFDIEKIARPQLVSIPSEEEKVYQVDVVVNISFNFAWTTYVDSKLIKTISFRKAASI